MSEKSELTRHKHRIPDDLLASASGEASYVGSRYSLVLVFPHQKPCVQCQRYLDELSRESPEFASWDSQLVLIVTGRESAGLLRGKSAFRLIRDPQTRLLATAGILAPGIVIVDQWRDIQHAQAAGTEHAFPTVQEVLSWVRYLATQCPECEGESL
jgi:hypothetical protein